MCMEVSPSKKIREGLIKFGVDGVSTTQGAKSGVIVHVIKKNSDCPLHCISHQSYCANPFPVQSGETCEGSFGNIVFLLQLLPSNAPLSSQS